MASVTLFDGETGQPLLGDEADPPDPIVEADHHAGVTFALDPGSGTALVQFVVDPGHRRLVAGVEFTDGDDLSDLHRAIRRQVARSDHHVAPPGRTPPHLNVFHYLAAPDPVAPAAEIRGHLVSTYDPVDARAPSAADAVGVAAFFRERAPWKGVAVHSADAAVATAEDAVAVAVDGDVAEVTYPGRDESWIDEEAVPDEPSSGPDAVTAGRAAEGGSERASRSGTERRRESTGRTDPRGDDEPGGGSETGGGSEARGDGSPVLRLYDGESGELEYDSTAAGQVPRTVSEEAERLRRDGLALFVDPAAGLLRATMGARGDGTSRRYLVEYDRREPAADLLASFRRELEDRVDDLGVEFFVDVAGHEVGYDQLSDAEGRRPAALAEGDLRWLRRADAALDFVAPDGAAAFELTAFLGRHLGGGRSVAICSAGRTDDLAAVDVVVTPDADCEEIEPRGEAATALAGRRTQERVAEAESAVGALVARVDEVTGTAEARQRFFAAALSGAGLARQGLAAVPVDDDPVGRKRRQASYLTLYGLLLAGLAGGAYAGRFDPLAAVLAGSYRITVVPPAGTPLAGVEWQFFLRGGEVVGGCLAAMLVGAYLLFGHPRGPLSAARALSRTVRRQLVGGARSAPPAVHSLAEPLEDPIEDLAAAYERLAGGEGTTAARSEDLASFLEEQLLAGSRVPSVTLVGRRTYRLRTLVGVVAGVLVGAASAGAVLGALAVALGRVRGDPTVLVEVLLGVAAVTLVAAVLKSVAVRYGRGRPPRWSTAR